MLDLEQFTALDTETHLIGVTQQAPPMVCLSTANHRGNRLWHRRDSECLKAIEAMFNEALTQDRYIVGQHIAYDMGVIGNEWPHLLPVIFRLYDSDRVMCTIVRQKLIDIGKGEHVKGQRYNLEVLAKQHHYPGDVSKQNPWRLRYSELDNVPVRDWPKEAVEYPLTDGHSTLYVALSQEDDCTYLDDQFRQSRAAFGLQLVSAWGIRTDRIMVARYRAQVEAKIERYKAELVAADLIYQDKRGEWHKRAKKAEALAVEAWEGNVPREFQTKGGKASLDSDACAAMLSPILTAYQGFSSASTAMSRVESMEQGTSLPLHTRFDSLVETGRTSSSDPNIQNVVVEPGARECFVPRKGNVLLVADFDANELRSICQGMIHLGLRPRMADVLNAGGDPHCMVAATILGCSYDEAVRRCSDPEDKEAYLARQCGKIGNFGKYGGLGKESLRIQARAKYKVKLTEAEVDALVDGWMATWPEAQQYFDWVRGETRGGRAWFKHFVSNRHRGNIPYTVLANTVFQGLAADETKAVLWALVRECYVGQGILSGSRVVNYVHDEYHTEVPESDQLQEFADAYQKLLTETANEWLPDVPTRAKPMAVRRWSKKAKAIKDAKGRLGVWEWDEAIKAGSPGYAT